MNTSPEPSEVFLSYSRLDSAVVAPIAKLLRLTHACIFRDEDSIPLGKRWEDVISEALMTSHTVIVFWSVAAADSKVVAEEYAKALELGKDIVPVLLDDTPVDKSLAQHQWLDFREFVREGRYRSIVKQADAVGSPVGFMPILPSVYLSHARHLTVMLLQKAAIKGFGVEWDDATEKQITHLLSCRIGSLRSG